RGGGRGGGAGGGWHAVEQPGDGQADAVDRDGVAGASAVGDLGAADENAGGVPRVLYRLDFAEVLHDAGEHPRPPPVRGSGGTRQSRVVRAFTASAPLCGASASGTTSHDRPRTCCLPSGL